LISAGNVNGFVCGGLARRVVWENASPPRLGPKHTAMARQNVRTRVVAMRVEFTGNAPDRLWLFDPVDGRAPQTD
jgi:hypothetical protein